MAKRKADPTLTIDDASMAAEGNGYATANRSAYNAAARELEQHGYEMDADTGEPRLKHKPAAQPRRQ